MNKNVELLEEKARPPTTARSRDEVRADEERGKRPMHRAARLQYIHVAIDYHTQPSLYRLVPF